jgi:hypothetical protein
VSSDAHSCKAEETREKAFRYVQIISQINMTIDILQGNAELRLVAGFSLQRPRFVPRAMWDLW